MIHFLAQNLAPVMFASMVLVLLLGFPVAFSLAAVGLGFFVIGVELAPLAPDSITLSWPLLGALPNRVFGIMSNEVLLAIPFFTFMGMILERSGMAEDLLETVGQLFGPIRGGLAYAVIFVGALLAATTGVIAATVISMGLISLPIMLRYGYNRSVASGTIAASGTLSQIIPPSIVLIVLADQLDRSVGDMYAAALLPGLVLCGLYVGYIFMVSIVFPKSVPALPPSALIYREANGSYGVWQLGVLVAFSLGSAYLVMLNISGAKPADMVILTICLGTATSFVASMLWKWLGGRQPWAITLFTAVCAAACLLLRNEQLSNLATLAAAAGLAGIYVMLAMLLERGASIVLMSKMANQFTLVMVPPLLLVFLVLGTIFVGIATPTEGGAMGAMGALALAGIKRLASRDPGRLNLSIITQAARSTAKLSAFAMFILLGARVFSLTFYGINGHIWVEHLLSNLPGGTTGFLVAVNFLIFFLAFFLDFFELAFIIVPLLAPAAESLGIDLVWLGIILAVNMQTSFMHPPFGFALFYLRSVAPKTAYADRVTGKQIEPVTTGQIYLGALPYLGVQIAMVAIIVLFPQLVTHYKGEKVSLAGDELQQKLNEFSIPDFGVPDFGASLQ